MAEEIKETTADTLSKVWDSMLSSEEKEEKVEETSKEEEEVVEEEAAAEKTEDVHEEVEEDLETKTEEPREEEKVETAPESLPAPEHWPADERATFSKLPREAQEQVLRRDKVFQDSARRAQERSAHILRAMEPIKDEITRLGLSEEQAIRNLIGAHLNLSDEKTKIDAARNVLELYGITIEDLTNPERVAESEVSKKVSDLERKLSAEEGARQFSRIEANRKIIEQFRAGEGAEFFDQVKPKMEMIGLAYYNAGQAVPPIKELYEEACHATPQIERVLIERELKNSQEKARNERAKRAAETHIESNGVSSKPKEMPRETRDILKMKWDELEKQERRKAL